MSSPATIAAPAGRTPKAATSAISRRPVVRRSRDFALTWHAVPLVLLTLLAGAFVLAGGG